MTRWSVPLRPILSALVIGFALLGLCWLATSCGPVPAPEPPQARVQITVTVTDTRGKPLGGALTWWQPMASVMAATTADGIASLSTTGLNSGVCAKLDGYHSPGLPGAKYSCVPLCDPKMRVEFGQCIQAARLMLEPNAAPPPPAPLIRPGQVTLCGAHGLCDGAGRHYFGGASLFWAPWAYANDRPRLDAALKDLAPGAHDFVRIFGHITGPSPWWDNRHNDLTTDAGRKALAGAIDYLAERGLRSWVVVFADVSYTPAGRSGIVDAILPILQARTEKILLVEVVNEGLALKPTAFPLAESRTYADRIASALPNLVVVTSPASESCADLRAVSTGDLAAPHFSRATSGTKGAWTPPSQPWMGDTQPRFCGGKATLDGEGIGIGSSVTSDNDPTRLAMARATGAAAGQAGDVLHSAAGVYGRIAFHDQPGFMAAQEAVRQMRAVINTKPDIQDWSRGGSSDGPWTVRTLPNDSQRIAGTIDRLYCTWRGAESWCAALDVRGTTTPTAKQPMHVSVRAGGTALTEVQGRDLNAGESITLTPATPGAVVIGRPR